MCISPLYASDDSNWTSGKSLGTSMLGYFKSDMSSTINTPVTTESKLSTVDGTKKGSAQLICSAGNSKEYLEIGYSGTSDISITFKMDKNLDGTKETIWNFSGVSGICSNGVVKCSAGTWSNCQYYQWNYNSTTLQLSNVVASALGGCYCINSSCGGLATTENVKILNDIAGGAGSLISNSNSKLVITKVQTNNTSVKYWGQDYSNCTNESNIPSTIDDNNINLKTDEVKFSQSADKNSAYYIVSESSSNVTALDNNYKSDLTKRTTVARNTAKNTSGNNYSYTESLNNGEITGTLFLGSFPKAKYCEVQWEENNTASFNDGTNRKTATTNPKVIKTEIRECIKDWTECPIYNNENIKHECGEIDDFAEVTSALNAVSEAIKDMICGTN